MPAKLERCVKKVKKQGKDESQAYAICSSSTGWKKRKGGGWRKGKKVYKESTKIAFCPKCKCEQDVIKCRESAYICAKCKNRFKITVETTFLPHFDKLVKLIVEKDN